MKKAFFSVTFLPPCGYNRQQTIVVPHSSYLVAPELLLSPGFFYASAYKPLPQKKTHIGSKSMNFENQPSLKRGFTHQYFFIFGVDNFF
ncbi:MAG: hypothetical protein FWD36_09455 [Treponema sp.]|nr:hypothetical protein [Treponema sp.]